MATAGFAARTLDVGIAALAAVGAALAFNGLPAGSALRVLLVAPALVWAPGYLLLEACTGRAPPPEARLRHVLIGFGTSPPLVALLALSTALQPHGFRAGPMVSFVTVACLVLAAIALWRRRPRRADERNVQASVLARPNVVQPAAPRTMFPSFRPGHRYRHRLPNAPPPGTPHEGPHGAAPGAPGEVD